MSIFIDKANATCTVNGYTGVYDGAAHGASGSCTGVGGADLSASLNLGATFTDVPGGTANWSFSGGTNYNDQSGTASIVITKALLTVSPDPYMATRQYSDGNPAFVPSYTGFVNGEADTVLDTPPTCSATATESSPAGNYPITCTGGSAGNYDFSYTEGSLTVTEEDATVAFADDNLSAVKVTTAGSNFEGDLSLTVHVYETLPDSALYGAAPGDIAHAYVDVVTLTPLSGGGSTTLTCDEGTVTGSGYDSVKTFVCKNNVNLGVDVYDVTASVSGTANDYYTGTGYDTFTVYDPSLGFATGGGWFYWPDSAIPEDDYPGDKTNFGFTVKYNKKGQNVQGNLVVVRHHADGTISRMKSNQLDPLVIKTGAGSGSASFSGKATYMTWDDTLATYVNQGGTSFSVYAYDGNEPGTGTDKLWVRNMGNLVMDGTGNTGAVSLGGGNIVVPHAAK